MEPSLKRLLGIVASLFGMQLVAPYHKDHIDVLTRIVFSSDGKQLMAFQIDGSTRTWDATSGEHLEHSQPLHVSLLQNRNPEGADEAALRYYPVDSSYFGHWAYIDGKIIRSCKNGSTTIIDNGTEKSTEVTQVKDLVKC